MILRPSISESSIKDKKQSVNTKPGIGGLQLPGPGRRYRFLLPRVVPVQNDGGSTSGLSDLTTGSSSPSLSVTGSISVPSESMSLCSPKPSPPASPTLDQTEEKGEKRVQKRIYRARQDRLNTLPKDQALYVFFSSSLIPSVVFNSILLFCIDRTTRNAMNFSATPENKVKETRYARSPGASSTSTQPEGSQLTSKPYTTSSGATEATE